MGSNFIKSPLNYTGNKFRILNQILPLFPKKIDTMVDLFCGGATVGLNVKCKKVIFIDQNKYVINLLVFLSKQNAESFLSDAEKLIVKYGLSYSFKKRYSFYRAKCKNVSDANGLKDFNKKGFNKLRSDYNKLTNKNSDKANIMLYLLMVYGFNNDIRFNSKGKFNIPVGKTDLNKQNVEKIRSYINRIKRMNAKFLCLDFNDPKVKKILLKADFVYMDPPYLLGDAVYNVGWDNSKEYDLLHLIDWLIKQKKKFALSNVIKKKEKINEPLSYWCCEKIVSVKVNHIKYHYRSSSYNKKNRDANEEEVLITSK